MVGATSNAIALILIVAIIGMVYMLAYLGKTDTDVFKVLVGALISVGFTNIVGFYFGSSASSKAKDETITTLATGTGAGSPAVTAAAQAAAPAAAQAAAPPAAEAAAPPVVAEVVPPAVKAAVAEAFAKQDKENNQ